MTLFNRLLLTIFGMGLIPIIPTAFFLFYYQSVAKNNIQTLHENIAQMASVMISHKTDELNRRMYTMWEPGADYISQAALKKTLDHNPEFLFMAFTGPDGREILSAGAPEIKRIFGYLDISRNELFKKAVKTGRPALGEFELLYNLPICRLIYPLESGYYAFTVVNLRDLFIKLAMRKMGSTGGVFVADPDGRVFMLGGDPKPVDQNELKNFFLSRSRSSRKLSGRVADYIGSYSKVPGFELYALTLQARREAFRGINLLTSLIMFFLLGISTVFYFSALILSRRLINPVGELIEGAKRVSERNFKVPVGEKADITEIAALLKAFNAMMREVDRYHGLQVEKMLEEKQKVELLIGLIHDAIILSDFRGELMYANAAARSLLGLKDGETPVPENERLRRRVCALVNLKAKAKGEVMEMPGPDGREKKVYRVSMQVLSSKTSRPGVFMVLRDITLEAEIQRMKEELFHSVAHDLRAPLLTMQGYIKLLENSCAATEKSAGYLANIKSSSSRLFEMLENILDIAKLDAGNVKPRLAQIRTVEFLEGVFKNFKALFAEKNVEFVFEPGPVPAVFRGDERLLKRVFENLLSNAYKFTPAGGTVRLGAKPEKGAVSFYVLDTGPGIPGGLLKTVFEKYRQLGGPEEEPQGFGLGLAIAKKIVEIHNGTIRAEAEQGGGSRFVFELPL
ncbi:MAG: HAMP domain-containing protein [Elusimicrobia bacterium]|nr:HAMP domain-containing protein [Elusimicrobiota bacterium]